MNTCIPSAPSPLYSRFDRASSPTVTPSTSHHDSPTSRQPPHIPSRTASSSTLRPSAARPPPSPSASPSLPSRALSSTSSASLPISSTVAPSEGKARASIRRVFSSLGLRKGGKEEKPLPTIKNTGQGSEGALELASRRVPAAALRRDGLRNWAEYNAAYAEGSIDIQNPPVPPSSSSSIPLLSDLPRTPNAYDNRLFEAPYPPNEGERQRIVTRLDLFGRRARARQAPAMRTPSLSSSFHSPSPSLTSLAPSSLSSTRSDSYFSHRSSISTVGTSLSVGLTSASSMKDHPGLWNIVGQAKELFGARFAMLSVLDGEKQRFLATAGLPDHVEGLSRKGSICAHTILNGGRELVVLDAEKDWRFGHADLSVVLGVRFYTGVPIYAPAPAKGVGLRIIIGTLSVADDRRRRSAPPRDLLDRLYLLAGQASKDIAHWLTERDDANPDPLGSHIFDGPPPQPFPSSLSPLQHPARPLQHQPARRLDPDLQTILDMAMQLLCETLSLSLSYLVALDSPTSLRLIASHHLPPSPTFDVPLHLEALRSAEGGLRYRGSGEGFSGGMLLAVGEVGETGYVVGGFVRGKEVGREEMREGVRFAVGLEAFVRRL